MSKTTLKSQYITPKNRPWCRYYIKLFYMAQSLHSAN